MAAPSEVAVGDVLAQDLNNPNSAQFRRGLLGNDSPWSYRASGVYQLPQSVFVSGTWQYYQGFPETTTVAVGNNTVALTQGSTTLVVEPRGTTRLTPVASVDFSVRKSFKVQQSPRDRGKPGGIGERERGADQSHRRPTAERRPRHHQQEDGPRPEDAQAGMAGQCLDWMTPPALTFVLRQRPSHNTQSNYAAVYRLFKDGF